MDAISTTFQDKGSVDSGVREVCARDEIHHNLKFQEV